MNVTITETEYAILKASNDEARRIAKERNMLQRALRNIVESESNGCPVSDCACMRAIATDALSFLFSNAEVRHGAKDADPN